MDYKKRLDDLILELDSRAGSDIHLSSGSSVAIRIDGELVFLDDAILTTTDIENFLAAILGERKRGFSCNT